MLIVAHVVAEEELWQRTSDTAAAGVVLAASTTQTHASGAGTGRRMCAISTTSWGTLHTSSADRRAPYVVVGQAAPGYGDSGVVGRASEREKSAHAAHALRDPVPLRIPSLRGHMRGRGGDSPQSLNPLPFLQAGGANERSSRRGRHKRNTRGPPV